MMHAYLNGRGNLRKSAIGGGPSLAMSSNHSEAKVDAAARAAYGAMMLGLIGYDHASPSLKQKSRLIAIAVLDAADRIKTQ